MDLLNELFRHSELPNKKVSKMLDVDLYWQIIANSLQDANSLSDQENNIIKELEVLTAEDIIGFYLRTLYYLFQLYTNEAWCASAIMNDSNSEDSFYNFRLWVISQGYDFYMETIQNPDSLSEYFEDGINEEDLYEFENFAEIADSTFFKIFNIHMHDYIDYMNFPFFEEDNPEIDFTWSEDNLTSMQVICPRLFKLFIEDFSDSKDDDDDDDEDDEDDFFFDDDIPLN